MNGSFELGVYLTHFINVDLFRQGVYFFRLRVYSKQKADGSGTSVSSSSTAGSSGKKQYALPYRTMSGAVHEQDFLLKSTDKKKSAGHVDSVTNSYCSSNFRVQFQEQRVRLNEGCLFRIDLPYRAEEIPLYIDIELVFSEMHASDYKSAGVPDLDSFSIVDTTSLCMEHIHEGVHALYPATFSPSHFCLLYVMVHCELVNFKYIPPSFAPMVGALKSDTLQEPTSRKSKRKKPSKRAPLRPSAQYRATGSLTDAPHFALKGSHRYKRRFRPVGRSVDYSAESQLKKIERGEVETLTEVTEVEEEEEEAADGSTADAHASARASPSSSSSSSKSRHISCLPTATKKCSGGSDALRHLSGDLAADLREDKKKEEMKGRGKRERLSVKIVHSRASDSEEHSHSSVEMVSPLRESDECGVSGAVFEDVSEGSSSELVAPISVMSAQPKAGKSSFAEMLFGFRLDCRLRTEEWAKALNHHVFYITALFETYHRLSNIVTESIESLLDPSRVYELTELDELYPVPSLELPKCLTSLDRDKSTLSHVLYARTRRMASRRGGSSSSSASESGTTPLSVVSLSTAASDDCPPPEDLPLVRDLDWKGLVIYAEQLLHRRHASLRSEGSVATGRQLCQLIAQDIHEVAAQLFRVWHFFLGLVPHCKRKMSRALRKQWEHQFVERWSACIFRETLTVRDRTRVVTTSLSEHSLISSTVRKQQTLEQLDPPPLQDLRYMGTRTQAVIFEQTYNLLAMTPKSRAAATVSLPSQSSLASATGSQSSHMRLPPVESLVFAKGSHSSDGIRGGDESATATALAVATATTTTIAEEPPSKPSRISRLRKRLLRKSKKKKKKTTSAAVTAQTAVSAAAAASTDDELSSGRSFATRSTRAASDTSDVVSAELILPQDSLGLEQSSHKLTITEKNPDAAASASASLLRTEESTTIRESVEGSEVRRKLGGRGGHTLIVRRSAASGTASPTMSDRDVSVTPECTGAEKRPLASASPVDAETEETDGLCATISPPIVTASLSEPRTDAKSLSFSIGDYLETQDSAKLVSGSSGEEEEVKKKELLSAAMEAEETEDKEKEKEDSGSVVEEQSLDTTSEVSTSTTDDSMSLDSSRLLESILEEKKRTQCSPSLATLSLPSRRPLGRGVEHDCIGKHVFVLVHGYQGNSWDMRMFRNHVMVLCPHDLFLLSACNEKDGFNDGDIAQMGERLAEEIEEFIIENVIAEGKALCRLSFVTHSLGGVVAREALASVRMKPYVARCHTYISLAVCHCGYLFGRSKAIQAGFWVMRSWKKSVCLSQLSLSDAEDPRQTYLYRLSLKPGLQFFDNVLLVSSPEDRYTPYHSTRIEMHRKTVQDTKWGRVYNDMVRNLLRPLDHVNLTRFDVSFHPKKMNLDSMIGRTAHICFLEQPLYIDMLIYVYKRYFASVDARRRRYAD